MKLVGVVVAGLLVANCSATYNMKSEKGKVLNQKEIEILSDDIYKRLQAAVDSDGNYDSKLLTKAAVADGLNPQQIAAIDMLAQQMNSTADAMYNDQIEAGGDLGQRKNYLHKYKTLNKVAVQKNRNEFEAYLFKHTHRYHPLMLNV